MPLIGTTAPDPDDESSPLPAAADPGERGYANDIHGAPYSGGPSFGNSRHGWEGAEGSSAFDIELRVRLRRHHRRVQRRTPHQNQGKDDGGGPVSLPRYTVSTAPILVALSWHGGEACAPWIGALGVLVAVIADLIQANR